MNTEEIWLTYAQELYFFILKNVKSKDVANDILQNSFLKIHKNLHQLKTQEKLKAWVFQIGRNEIINYLNKQQSYQNSIDQTLDDTANPFLDICCFDRFISELPANYKEVIELTYLTGKKQEEVADLLDLSLANVKARIRRSKIILKQRFQECCKFETNKKGDLIGTPNCANCE